MQDSNKPVYRDANRSVDERVADLLARMTLDEKLGQIGCYWSRDLIIEGAFSEALARERLAHGIGQITRIGGSTALRPAECAAMVNAFQEFLVHKTRLGIPAIIHEESLAGFLARDATCFPQAIGLAATWDPALIEAVAGVVREQMLAVGAREGLAPVLDVARDPRWGRTEETYGEDPYLIGQLGTAYVRGLQTDDLRAGVAATGKHFVTHSAPEGGLNWAPAHVGERELREVYAAPFEMAIKEAGLATVMNAYHEIDGVPCGSNRKLLRDFLRGELGFDGLIVADYFTLENLVSYHRVAADQGDAARLALEAGIDVELPALVCYGAPLRQALEEGRVDPALIDASAANMLRLKFQLGLFEQPFVDVDAVAAVFNTPAQRALARKAAQESIVMLKNAGDLLPLSPDVPSIAVIGPGADSLRVLQGDYHYPSHMEIMPQVDAIESAMPTPTTPFENPDLNVYFPPMVTVLEGIRAAVGPRTVVRHVPGCDLTGPSLEGFDAAVEAARQSHVAVLVVGGKSGLNPSCTSGEAVDRATLDLPGVQQQLVEAIACTGTPVIVVVVDGRPLALPWIAEHIPAVLVAWLPGEEGGTAIADVLFGKCDPGGRLPMTLPRGVGQVPVFYGHKPSGGRSHWYTDYTDLPTSPLYPFGHGLSYTTFSYANLRIDPAEGGADGTVTIRADVTNTGSRAGDEVVQLYTYDPIASVTRPVKELKGFQRLHLDAGECRTVTFRLAISQLGFFDLDLRFVVEPGAIEVMLGASATDIRLVGGFEITGPVTDVRARRVYSTLTEVQ